MNAPPMPGKAFGFTLIELIVTITILAILMMIAAPSFSRFIKNIEVRNDAESVVSGIQRARAEAVGRNATVFFILNADSSWTISKAAIGDAPAIMIETRQASEGSRSVERSVIPTGATSITFNNLGVITGNTDASASLEQIVFSAAGSDRPLTILIGAGGAARLCDASQPSGRADACD